MADPAEVLKRLRASRPQQDAEGAESAGEVLARLKAARGKPGGEIVFVADNGGQVTKGPNGLSYAGPEWHTSDPANIERIMAGEEPGAILQSLMDQQTIEQAPFTARAQEWVRGIPFVGSYSDEVTEAIHGKPAADFQRELSGAMQRENPGETMALNMGGAITSTAPVAVATGPAVASMAPAARTRQVALAMGGGGALGAAEGAIYQYGDGGDPAAGAAVGGTLGAVLGLAAPYAARGVENIAKWFKTTDVSQIASELAISAEAATVIRNAFRNGDTNAARQQIEMAGPSGMLADGGQPARELLDAAATAGGQAGAIARDAVESRAAQSSEEMGKALDSAFGTPIGRETAVSGVRSGTSQARSDAYQAAYSQPIDYASSLGRRIESLMGRVPESAIKAANDLMSVRGVESKQILAQVGDDGKVTLSQMPDVQQLHYILQGLDDAIEGAKSNFGRNTTKSSALTDLRRQLSNTLKAAVPDFRAAQDIAADSIRQEKAVDAGWDLLTKKTKTGDLGAMFKDMSKAERDAMAQGVRGYIEESLANVSRTISDPNIDAREAMKLVRDFSSRANRAKLIRLLGRDKADTLLAAVDREAIALDLRAAIAQNSKTSIRDSIKQGVREQTEPGALGTLLQGEPVNATKRIVQALSGETSEARQLREMGIFEEIATALTQVRGAGAQRAVRSIESAIQGQPLKDAQAAQIAQVLVASGHLTTQAQATRALVP